MVVKTLTESAAQNNTASTWPPPQSEWTYEDYIRLPDDGFRYEIIQGELYMTPAPVPKHQKIIANLYGYLWEYLKENPLGELFFAPVDVQLPGRASPVQPDLLFIVIERLAIVGEKFIAGPPDLIVEVLSPASETLDRRLKYQIYAEAGVQEYWLIDPDSRTVEIFVRRGQAYAPLGTFGPEDRTRSELLPDFTVEVSKICPA